MKNSVLLLIVLSVATNVTAQQSKVNFAINNLHTLQVGYKYGDSVYHIYRVGIYMLPSIGYYRITQNNTIIGCEAGYIVINDRLEHVTAMDDNLEYIGMSDHYEQYYLCPSLLKQVIWKKYRFTTGLILPILYRINEVHHLYTEEKSKSANVINASQLNEDSRPHQLNIGIFANLGVERRIYKNIYLGAHLGLGIDNTLIRGNTHHYVLGIEYGTVRELDINEPQKYTVSQFNIRPTFSINYYF